MRTKESEPLVAKYRCATHIPVSCHTQNNRTASIKDYNSRPAFPFKSRMHPSFLGERVFNGRRSDSNIGNASAPSPSSCKKIRCSREQSLAATYLYVTRKVSPGPSVPTSVKRAYDVLQDTVLIIIYCVEICDGLHDDECT